MRSPLSILGRGLKLVFSNLKSKFSIKSLLVLGGGVGVKLVIPNLNEVQLFPRLRFKVSSLVTKFSMRSITLNFKVRSYGAAVAMASLLHWSQSVHIVAQRQWLSSMQCNAKYFAAAILPLPQLHRMGLEPIYFRCHCHSRCHTVWTSPFDTEESNCYDRKMLPLLQPLPHRVNGPLNSEGLIVRQIQDGQFSPLPPFTKS